MKKLIFIFLIFMLLNSVTTTIANGDDHHHHGGEHAVEDHCDNPTAELNVVTSLGEIAYDKEEYQVPKDTCVKVIYQNNDFVAHDFNIDAIEGSEGIQKVHIHLFNNTDGENGDGIGTQNIMTPNIDTEFPIYCTVENHRSSGMEAVLVVGDGNSTLPVLPIPLIFAFIALMLVKPTLKRNT